MLPHDIESSHGMPLTHDGSLSLMWEHILTYDWLRSPPHVENSYREVDDGTLQSLLTVSERH
jgi:hypothetical protein